MKKENREKVLFFIGLILFLLFFVFLDGGDILHSENIRKDSEYYSELEINTAILSAKQYFLLHFKGCELIEIGYAGDESVEAAKEWAKDSKASKAIILTSSFRSGNGRDDGLEPDKVYEGWQWIMVRRFGLFWIHRTHGYG